MRLLSLYALFALVSGLLAGNVIQSGDRDIGPSAIESRDADSSSQVIKPKVLITSLYDQEGETWYGIPEFNLLARNISVPGLSPIFPDVHCTSDGSICQVIAGEGEINAASSISALSFSPLFDLRQTYFLVIGVAGINPAVASTGSVTFARFAVQTSLQYEFDPRNLPSNFSTGYIPQGSLAPNQYPAEIYGTEVFELNARLRDAALALVKDAHVTLNDTAAAAAYRAKFARGPQMYRTGASKPSLVACDSVTSDVYFSGNRLNRAFDNYTRLVTNGSGIYCAAQQEDNAVLEPLMRAARANRVDFARVIIVRTASDFVPPPPGVSSFANLMYGQDGYTPALKNIRIAGVPIVTGIVKGWDRTFKAGIKPNNYVGDILGSLGGVPDFGPGPAQEPEPLTTLDDRKRDVDRRERNLKGRMARIGKRAKARGELPRMRLS